MENNSSLVKKICEQVIKYTLYISAFLVPILFLPFTSDVFDFNKQAVLIFLSFIALYHVNVLCSFDLQACLLDVFFEGCTINLSVHLFHLP